MPNMFTSDISAIFEDASQVLNAGSPFFIWVLYYTFRVVNNSRSTRPGHSCNNVRLFRVGRSMPSGLQVHLPVRAICCFMKWVWLISWE